MIYMAAALYPEAEPFIRTLGLKKQKEHTRFQVFASDTHTLILTGSGSLAAGIAVTYLLTCAGQHTADDSGSRAGDIFVQFGSCGAPADIPVGSLFLCHKITDAVTGRSFYPDMLYSSDFKEAALVTAPEPASKPAALTDMEGYGGYMAAFTFLPPNRIFTFKAVSDHGYCQNGNSGSDSLTPARLTELMAIHADSILSWLKETEAAVREESTGMKQLSDSVSKQADILSERYHFSVSNRLKLEKLLRYGYLCGKDMGAPPDLTPETAPYTGNPAKIKSEGRRFLHEFEQNLLS